MLVDVYGYFHIQSLANIKIRAGLFDEYNLHRHAMHHFYIISRGIAGGQQRELRACSAGNRLYSSLKIFVGICIY